MLKNYYTLILLISESSMDHQVCRKRKKEKISRKRKDKTLQKKNVPFLILIYWIFAIIKYNILCILMLYMQPYEYHDNNRKFSYIHRV